MRSILYAACTFLPMISFAQAGPGRVADRIQDRRAAGSSFLPVQLFQSVTASPVTDALWNAACTQASVLRYNTVAGNALLRDRTPFIAVEVSDAQGAQVLDLERVDITSQGFGVRLASTNALTEVPGGVHYRGVVRGMPGSVVALSVFEKEVMALIADADDERVIGRFEGDIEGLHAYYRESDLRATISTACATVDEGGTNLDRFPRQGGSTKTIRCVHVYWEAANDIYLNKGSIANVTSYLTGLFNQMATLYANDGVQVLLNEIYVWDVASPYNGTSSSSRLSQFGTTRTSFNGELAHLLDYGGYGGVAWLNTLCGGTSSRMAYSGISSSFNNVPTYSWSVMVVAHETGHNMGSSHTHACAWNGNNTAIDGCGPTAGYSEGACPNAGLPAGGGTIMSYCHLIGGTGINLSFGFGPQPALRIRERVNAGSCLLQCGSSCDAPTPLTVTNLNATSATLNWSNYGVLSYTLRWKLVSSGTWNTITGLTATSYALTGLTLSENYEYQVLSVCAAGSSTYSASKTFTTPVPCPDSSEPNNTTGTAALLTLPTSVNALIASSSDVDYYRFVLSATSNVNLSLSNLPADYDLRLLNSGGTQIAISSNGGSSSESISYANATAGTYFIHVYGYQNVFSTVQCYLLNASAYVTACNIPQGLSSNTITYNSANITWSAPGGGTGSTFDLRWKPTSSGTWTNVNGLAASPYALGGLTQLTSYDVQVRAVCGGVQGTVSEYSTTHSFTTLQAPCDVIPRSVVAARVFLDGAYRTATGLMSDSLRVLGLVPLTEPYSAMGRTIAGPTTTTALVLATTGNNAVVDWVMVELRSTANPATILETRVGLVQRDGDVVAPDGSSPLGFCPDAGNYRVAVRHRNHLGCMTGANIALNGTATAVDFTLTALLTYGSGARKSNSGIMALWSGNVDPNNELKYTGQFNDRDPILTAIGGSVPTLTASGYLLSDVTMDGIVRYVGANNDRDPILSNIGGSVPTVVMGEQLP
ncbi:MAG: fibronectin type III domain-containing protein [Flavobacteriales bacterium]|nr:fibronectin type III domain-containing protein [Flavobacteriales bacterium]